MRSRSFGALALLALPVTASACSADAGSAAAPAPSVAEEAADPPGIAHVEEALGGLAKGALLPTGARITPLAANGAVRIPLDPGLSDRPDYRADHLASLVVSPDGTTLAGVTSGYNLENGADGNVVPAWSQEYLFVWDATTFPPTKRQAIPVRNAFYGVAFAPQGDALYVAGGVDDVLHTYAKTPAGFQETGTPIPLRHGAGLGLGVKPEAAGVAVTADGTRAVIANYANDSVSVVDLTARAVTAEVDLRPGKVDPASAGKAGGEYPFWVSIRGNDEAFVTSQRDNEVVVVALSGAAPRVSRRIAVGVQPSKAILNRAGTRLFVANASSDSISVIDTALHTVVETIDVVAPHLFLENPRGFKGANPNALALSPDERTLYVTDAGTNAVAVVRLGARGQESRVEGLVPTGWYPSAVAVAPGGGHLFVADAKGVAGPNPEGCRDGVSTASGANAKCNAANQYSWQLEKGDLLALPTPDRLELFKLSLQVAKNDRFPIVTAGLSDALVMAYVRRHIKHVVYVIKENRTYDQILGDLEVGDGDPALAIFPDATTPNHHAVARSFVALDKFYDSGESSGVGWNWSTAARTTDAVEKTQPVNYAGRGLSYDWEGTNRNVNVGYATTAERTAAMPYTPADPDLLPGATDVSAPTAPGGEAGTGYLWDAALRKGLTVRNYGCFGDLTRYSLPSTDPAFIALDEDPHRTGRQVFFPAKAALAGVSDLYYRGYDNKFPDYFRIQEWTRELEGFEARGDLPNLSFVRLMHDHFGNFGSATHGVNTPERQMADNDYAVGLLVERISKSRFAKDTLVFVVEDDSQDGPDHVDAHRSIALVAGPFVKQGAVISTPYTTVSLVRTIVDVLGLEPLGLNDALAAPMSEVFEWQREGQPWTYDAVVPAALRATQLPLPAPTAVSAVSAAAAGSATRGAKAPRPHDAAWWERATEGERFDVEDELDEERFNRALWRGLAGSTPYPASRHGRDLSQGRAKLLGRGTSGGGK